MNKKNYIVTFLVILSLGVGVYIFTSMGPSDQKGDSMIDNSMKVQSTDINNENPKKSTTMEDSKAESKGTIVDIAVSNPEFSTLVTALQEADLVEVLSSDGPFTVFAPTNEAFSKIPEATLNEILADKEQLTSILTYHVVPGKVMSSDVVNVTSAETVQGSDLNVKVEGNSVMINNANVVAVDIEADNGVIHVIDTVLIPQ